MSVTEPDVWVVDDDQSVRWVLEKALRQAGIGSRSFERAEHLLEAIEHGRPDVLITDVRMPGMSGIGLLERLRERCPELPIIVITAHSDLENAVASYKGGAFEYLPKPFDIDEAIELVRKAARAKGIDRDRNPGQDKHGIPSLIGQAPAMQEVFRSIGRLAGSSMTVLITGESGTGKELVARALHEHSPRANKPFVALNTSAIASELLESELFGHEKGASPAPTRDVSAASSRRMVAPCSWTKSATCLPRCRHASCEYSPKASSIGSAGRRRSRSTCGSLPQPTRTSRAR